MKLERLLFTGVLVLSLMTAGCAGHNGGMSRYFSFSQQERDLGAALNQLHSGNEQQAYDLLNKIVDAEPVSGVTDEALFRLALLNLKDDSNKSLLRAQSLLDRLSEKYPASLWTRQSAQLHAYLRRRQREQKSQKELSRDNRELRQNLERLKQLDLELEQRIKR